MFVFLEGLSKHRIKFRRTRFRMNQSSGSGGGGLGVAVRDRGTGGKANSVKVYNSEFSGNVAQYGAGAYFLPIGKWRAQ